MTRVSFEVNGHPVTAEIEPRQHLADFLRENMLLTGTHLGCEHGVCGACTVLVDGEPVRSCITFAVTLEGARITTIEGLDEDPAAAALREAFSEEHGLQCGYCTPGMLVMARDIVRRLPGADAARIRRELAGNLCRCTGYQGIVHAVHKVANAGFTDIPAVPVPTARPQLGPVSTAASRAATDDTPAEAPTATEPADITLPTDAVHLEEAFVVGHAPDRVWAFFKDPSAVARCMPGASLDRHAADGRVGGRIAVKLGPMTPSFAGEGVVTYDDKGRRGEIRGRGLDRSSSSQATGRVRFAVLPDGNGSRVELGVDYALSGPLARFSRGGLARDLASRLTATFARNLEAALAGETPAPESAELRAGGLFLAALWARIRRLLGLRG